MSENSGPPDGNTPISIKVLLAGAVDYAGLFPPAALNMESAVRKYAEHRRGPYQWVLGRFVVPVSRLEEFNFSALDLLGSGSKDEPWRLAALSGPELRADMAKIEKFNKWHDERRDGVPAVIEVVETKARSPEVIEVAGRLIPDSVAAYFEIPTEVEPGELIDAISRSNAGAKLRMGGVTPEMFPPAVDLVRFLQACYEKDVVIKATAGLHHPLCSIRNLTYDPGAPKGRMYGFLNLMIAAACARESAGEDVMLDVLNEESADSFTFDDLGIRWNGYFLSTEVLGAVRRRSIASFGSCSVDEPVGDLKGLQLL
ncbi:MAG: hypothetical protein P8181_05680 [bacterium]